MKIYKHLKTGCHYLLIGKAKLEWNLNPVIVYKSLENDKLWVRPEKEFFDGRFIEVKYHLQNNYTGLF